jgi:hypothetical protein
MEMPPPFRMAEMQFGRKTLVMSSGRSLIIKADEALFKGQR